MKRNLADKLFWKIVYNNCDHQFEYSRQCGEIACDKCYTTYARHERLKVRK